MGGLRPVINVLLCVLLAMQGFAAAASQRAADSPPGNAAASVHCHGTAAAGMADEDASCCNVTCPDMSACVFTHLATGTPSATFAFVPESTALTAPVTASVSASPPKSLLRPPIASRA